MIPRLHVCVEEQYADGLVRNSESRGRMMMTQVQGEDDIPAVIAWQTGAPKAAVSIATTSSPLHNPGLPACLDTHNGVAAPRRRPGPAA